LIYKSLVKLASKTTNLKMNAKKGILFVLFIYYIWEEKLSMAI